MEEREKGIIKELEALHIGYEMHRHKAVHTFDEASKECTGIMVMQTKNLFLRNAKKTAYYLVVIDGMKRADLKALAKLLHEQKLSFAGEEDLATFLNVTPGSVSPLGLMYDTGKKVHVILDADVSDAPEVAFHPNRNTVSLVIRTDDFKRFLDHTGHAWKAVVL